MSLPIKDERFVFVKSKFRPKPLLSDPEVAMFAPTKADLLLEFVNDKVCPNPVLSDPLVFSPTGARVPPMKVLYRPVVPVPATPMAIVLSACVPEP
ncbi:hypothetical protein FR483_n537R [Paramecium bursaria Chlorella virus FR483]|uniref:Uncharacterized protein n537R n=1 Tax=Paramecium bursaria Chlorella virus FR483 TaxID=399781 RepID=A7J7P1_PBCVF|nr:hypothetical protein FR483_n537R [Paramecium bursaria Chlorella virus FR483]ABT15822.1 hypothetical protein FR483_n537R [Paramecium bursaria Chlorella virus FR483]